MTIYTSRGTPTVLVKEINEFLENLLRNNQIGISSLDHIARSVRDEDPAYLKTVLQGAEVLGLHERDEPALASIEAGALLGYELSALAYQARESKILELDRLDSSYYDIEGCLPKKYFDIIKPELQRLLGRTGLHPRRKEGKAINLSHERLSKEFIASKILDRNIDMTPLLADIETAAHYVGKYVPARYASEIINYMVAARRTYETSANTLRNRIRDLEKNNSFPVPPNAESKYNSPYQQLDNARSTIKKLRRQLKRVTPSLKSTIITKPKKVMKPITAAEKFLMRWMSERQETLEDLK